MDDDNVDGIRVPNRCLFSVSIRSKSPCIGCSNRTCMRECRRKWQQTFDAGWADTLLSRKTGGQVTWSTRMPRIIDYSFDYELLENLLDPFCQLEILARNPGPHLCSRASIRSRTQWLRLGLSPDRR